MQEVKAALQEKMNGCRSRMRGYRRMVKPSLMVFAVYAIGASAILGANCNYRDDLRRVLTGEQGWGPSYGRWLSDFFSLFIHTDSYMTDISPLPQLLALVLVAAAAGIVWYVMSGNRHFSVWDLAALVPLGLSPYFLTCISYKFDAPYMALSVFASIAPVLFWEQGSYVYAAASFLGSLAMCTTYQAASGIFPMFVILVCLKRWNCGEKMKQLLKPAGISAAGYLAGLLVFRLFLMPPQKTDYVSSALPPLKDLIPTIVFHLGKYYYLIATEFRKGWLALLFLLGIAFVFVMVRDTKQKKLLAFAVSVLVLFAMLLLAFGVYPALSEPLYHPRGMYGFGAFLAFMGIAVTTAKKGYPAKLACFGLAWCFFVFSFVYGNALEMQDNYIDYRTEAVLDDLKDLRVMKKKGKVTIQMEGSIGLAPALRKFPEDYRLLERMLPQPFEDGRWSLHKFYYYGLKPKKVKFNKPNQEDFNVYGFPVLKRTAFHTIQGKGSRLLVKMKK